MINIEKYYEKEEEVRPEKERCVYKSMYKVLNKTFNFSKIDSLIDLGCATGHMIKNICKNHKNVDVRGVEFFAYHKESDQCSDLIKDKILIGDLRLPLSLDEKFDIVYSSEVGEHIDPLYADNYMKNILKLSKDIVILTWAGGIIWSQHFNPMEFDEFLFFCKIYGLEMDIELNKKLYRSMDSLNFHYKCYRESMTVFKKIGNIKNLWDKINLVGHIQKLDNCFGDTKIKLRKAMMDFLNNDIFHVEIIYELDTDGSFLRIGSRKFKHGETSRISINPSIDREIIIVMPKDSKYNIKRFEVHPIEKEIRDKLHL
jgi:hypothetical protein